MFVVMAAWLLQCNPNIWRVFDWWEETDEDLGQWTVASHLNDVARGDSFAFWISGREAGVYAVGRITRPPHKGERPSGGYWRRPPTADDVWQVRINTDRFLFDAPIRKAELAADPDFAGALILRMPGGANPFPLSMAQWTAIERRIKRRTVPEPEADDVVVTERALGTVVEETTSTPAAAESVRHFREAQLVKRYEKFLRRLLVVKTARLPTGERLVSDAFDMDRRRLIEAKASVSRQDVSMAIGQLLDYQKHVDAEAELAVLLPQRPAANLVELLRQLQIRVIFEHGSVFKEL